MFLLIGKRSIFFDILDFKNSKTFKGFNQVFDLQNKYTTKLELYFLTWKSRFGFFV